jgi:hypothetical protein
VANKLKIPGNSKQRKQSKKLLVWFREELGLSGSSPTPFYESNLFWGGLGIGAAIVTTAFTNAIPWLLVVAWPFLFIACLAMFKHVRSASRRWMLIVVSSLCLAATLVGLQIKFQPRLFGAEVELRMFSKGGEVSNGFWIIWHRQNECLIAPIDTLLFMRITNLKSQNTTVTGYSVEVRGNHDWNRLHKIDLRASNNTPIFTMLKGSPHMSATRAITLPPGAILLNRPISDEDFTNAGVLYLDLLDNELESKSIVPGDSFRGWAAFDFQHQKIDMRNQIRLTLIDESGETAKFYLNVDPDKEKVNILRHPIAVGPSFDVTGCKREDLPF